VRKPPKPKMLDSGHYCQRHTHPNFKNVAYKCVQLTEGNAELARSYGYDTIHTEQCAGCEGSGCDGPFGGILTAALRPFFGAPRTPEEVAAVAHQATGARRRRRGSITIRKAEQLAQAAGPQPPASAPATAAASWYAVKSTAAIYAHLPCFPKYLSPGAAASLRALGTYTVKGPFATYGEAAAQSC